MKKVLFTIAFFVSIIASIHFFKIGQSTEYWKGSVQVPGKKMEIIITLDSDLFGSTNGKISSPGQFVLNHKVTGTTLTGDSLKFEMNDSSPQTSFKGKINGKEITGKWSQGETNTDVFLEKTDRKSVRQAEAEVMVNYARQFAINRKTLNWDSLETSKYFSTDSLDPDSALIITGQKLFTLLNDNHGGVIYKGNYFSNPVSPKIKRGEKGKLSTYFYLFKMSPQMLEKDIAYIRIPTLTGQSKEEVDRIAAKIREAVCGLHYNSATNWIIDLRLNNGGNFPGMIAGIGNIVGDGIVGYATGDSEKPDEKLVLKNGNYYQNDVLRARSSMTCNLPDYKPKIAVMIGSGSNSAAEDICIALKGRADTRFFGEKTKGSVTGNSTLFIDEKTTFVLATSHYKDRTGKTYFEGIDPDVTIFGQDDFHDLPKDKKIIAALKWLKPTH